MHKPDYYFKMKINNPKVTLADEARTGVKEELRSGFLDWLHQFSVIGDDGELYSLGGSILSMHLEQMDLVSLQRQVIISRAEKQENFASI